MTREQWHSLTRLAVSGIAVDTLLFSHIGVPLFHRYRVFNRLGTHGAFRGTHMTRLHTFLEESDVASLRRRHRRCAKEIAPRMSLSSTPSGDDKSLNVSSRPKVYRRLISQARGSVKLPSAAHSSTGAGTVHSHRPEEETIQALMELALPRFGSCESRSTPARKPWLVLTDSPASPDPDSAMYFVISPSLCLNLDTLSSDDAGEPVIPRDISVTVHCGSDDGQTTMGSDQALSDVDLPAGSPQKIFQVVRWSVSMCRPADGSDGQTPPSTGVQALVPTVRPQSDEPELSSASSSPLVGQIDVPVVKPVEPVRLSSPPLSEHLSPRSPAMIAFEDLEDSSTPLSPNRVQTGRSQNMPADGNIFGVSPDTPAFVRRTSVPGAAFPMLLAFDSFSDPFFSAPIAFAQCDMIPWSDAPVTLPVHAMPPGAPCVAGQSSVSTVLASGVSSRTVQWSTDRDRLEDATREGPFDAVTSSMDSDDSPLVTAGLPGCPYRITSYTGPALSDMNPAFGLQLHHPRFLEFIGAPESAHLLYHSPSFWVEQLGEEYAMAAAVNLQWDAGLMMSNLQILSRFVTSLHRMSSEMISIGIGSVVFPAEEIADLSTAPRALRAAKYMAAMGLWRPQNSPGDPGPVPTSSCNSCMKCEYCFPGVRLPPE